MDLIDELSSRVLCGDGAMGTTLMEVANAPLDRCLEEFCLSAPDVVTGIHAQYIDAGARVIETNSFGASAVRLERYGLAARGREINGTAARLARLAAQGRNVYVAGSVGPLGLTADEAREQGIDREAVFREQIEALLDGGVDLMFFETFLDLDELRLALAVKKSLGDCPALCSMACAEEGRLPNGLPIPDALAALRELGAEITGVNCLNGPHAMIRLLEHLPVEPGQLLSAYPNAGYPRFHEGRFIYYTAPEYFGKVAREMVGQGVRLVGGCCGIGPAQVAAMAAAIRDLAPVTSKPVLRRIEPAPLPAAGLVQTGEPRLVPAAAAEPAAEETSLLDRIARGQTVVITELDPPKTLDLEKFMAGAKALHEAGSDAITLADNSLAILRVSNLAAGALLKARHGIMPLLHLSCRDRNLLGLQSELLGLSALGIRHVLPLTGDPAKVGDHPGAKSVYDVTSVQLIGIIKRLNEGFNHSGKSVKAATRFVIGCTFNPNAKFLDAQIARLERKLAAGAQYVMTQPVFDPALVEAVAKRTVSLGVPIFIGVWPLLNGRQAEFLHNEVPGILIPDAVRAKMAAREGAEGRAMGLELAKEVCRAVLDHFPGVYLITPFLNYELTVELAQFARR
jgi:methionine synthase I (cobalamin-dependent)/5,10-methylenetetrahydrofolate reductase